MYLSEIAIVDVTLIGPFGVLERIKIKSKTYIDFLQKNFMPWYNKTTPCIQAQGQVIAMRGPITHCTPHQGLPWQDGLQKRPFNDVAFLLVDLKRIENLWAIVKRHF